MNVSHKRLLWLWGGGLAVLLCLLFLPLTAGERSFSILLVMLAVVVGLVWTGRRPDTPLHDEVDLNGLPDAPYRLPVVLVCGDTDDFPVDGRVSRTADGCWLKVSTEALQQTVRHLLWLRPELVSQLAVMVCVKAQQYDDESALTASLLTLRWQMAQVRRDTRRQVPLLLTSTVAVSTVTMPLWLSVLPGEASQLWMKGEAPVSVATWGRQDNSTFRLRTQILSDAHACFVGEALLPVLCGDNPDMPAIRPAMVLYHQTPGMTHYSMRSLWQRFIACHTTLNQTDGWQPDASSPQTSSLPDFILPLLPQGHGVTPLSRALRRGLCLFAMAVLIALCSSGWNNRQLLHRVSFDVTRYNRIPMKDYAPKAKAVATLREDAALLNDWSRNGEPLHYGLGLYRGELLRPAVLAAIQSYVPPPPTAPTPPVVINTVVKGPETVRLDSLSLFDTGKWQLKPDSTKVLVSALVNIKAKPGWLIVVSGHTDDVGDDKSNQQLSLKRAESVRDWMRDTGDVPESCFAVQGYGESRPLQSNDTPEGRAANRRVEISLVPQADACIAPDTHHIAQQSDATKK